MAARPNAMTGPNRQALASRTAALALATAVLAAGCTSSGNGEVPVTAAGVPVTAAVSVIDNYDPETAASQAPDMWQVKYAVTDEQTITKLAELINSLPTAPNQNVVHPCPSSLSPAYQLDFQSSASATPTAVVSIMCFGVMVTLPGHDEAIRVGSAPPDDMGSVLRNVAALLAGSMPQTK